MSGRSGENQTGEVSRRQFLRTGVAAAAGASSFFIGGQFSRVRAAKGEVVICGWGGSLQEAERKAFFQPFEQETGIKVVETSPTDYGKLKAMVLSGNVEWDLVDAGDRHLFAGIQEGLLEKLDYAAVNTKDFLPQAVNPYGLGIFYWSTNIGISTRGTKKRPKTWADFYNVKEFPGARAMRNTSFDNMEIALLADGVPLDKIYPLTPDRIDHAYRVLDRIKPHVTKWWKVEAQVIQMLTDGEVDFAVGPGGRMTVVKRQGAQVTFDYDQGIVHGDSWVIPRGAKNKKNAMEFMAWYASNPKRHAEFSRHIPYGPLNTKAFDHMSDAEKAELPTAPENLKRQLLSDSEWWGKNLVKMEERWNAWLLR